MYLLKLVVITAILMLSALIVDYSSPDATMPAVVYFMIAAFALLTWAIHGYVLQANEKSPQRFVAHFMGSITVKLFASVAFLTIYLYLVKSHKIEVALSLLVTYMVFTTFEVVSMQKSLRGK